MHILIPFILALTNLKYNEKGVVYGRNFFKTIQNTSEPTSQRDITCTF